MQKRRLEKITPQRQILEKGSAKSHRRKEGRKEGDIHGGVHHASRYDLAGEEERCHAIASSLPLLITSLNEEKRSAARARARPILSRGRRSFQFESI